MNYPDHVDKAIRFAEANGYTGLRPWVEDHAVHLPSCPRTNLREIKYAQPLADRLPCRCGLEPESPTEP